LGVQSQLPAAEPEAAAHSLPALVALSFTSLKLLAQWKALGQGRKMS